MATTIESDAKTLQEEIDGFTKANPDIAAALELFNVSYTEYQVAIEAQESVQTMVSNHTTTIGRNG